MDDSPNFIYDGRDLGHWLRELTGAAPKHRRRAVAAIEELRFRPPGQVEAHGHAHLEAFDRAVRHAIHAPGFDLRAFLLGLVRLLQEPDRSGSDASDKQDSFTQSLVAAFVFLALDEEILLVPDQIRAMLRDPRRRWNALQVIERLGPRVRDLADELLAQLDAAGPRRPFDAPDALAAVLRDDPAMISGIVDRLDAPEPAVAEAAADTLYSLGPRAAELVPDCIERLLAAASRETSAGRAAIVALGRVTHGRDDAVELLLSLSRSPDPNLCGPALTALGDIARQPERVMPRLIEALNDYQEKDPDWLHYSQHERAVRALEAFGAAAAPAVPALIGRLRRDDGQIDRGVVLTLTRLGPAAREAVPALERLFQEEGCADDDLQSPEDLDPDADPVAWALLQLRPPQP